MSYLHFETFLEKKITCKNTISCDTKANVEFRVGVKHIFFISLSLTDSLYFLTTGKRELHSMKILGMLLAGIKSFL